MKQEPISYLVGSVIMITGCRSDMVLDGSTSYMCRMNADMSTYWDPEVDTVCKGMMAQAQFRISKKKKNSEMLNDEVSYGDKNRLH